MWNDIRFGATAEFFTLFAQMHATFRPYEQKSRCKQSTDVSLVHMKNRGSKHKTDSAPVFFNALSVSVILTCDLAGWDLTWQPHSSLSPLQEACGDGRRMTGAIDPPALSIGMSSQLHPPGALKGNFLRLIAERLMLGMRPRDSAIAPFPPSNFIQFRVAATLMHLFQAEKERL